MTIDIGQIQPSDAERRLLAELAEQTGKSWSAVLSEALAKYRRAETANAHEAESVYDALRCRLLGCLTGGPGDLSTNPDYIEGFGADDH